jgi:hemerythrin superfamily protein
MHTNEGAHVSSATQEREEAAKLPQDDVIGILLTQHARIRDLFDEVESARGDTKKEKFDELRALLAVHETAEEMILRPVTKKEAGEQQAEARNHEEQEANKVLSELEKMDLSSNEFDVKFGELKRAVAEHADHEEQEEFPAVHRGCSQEQLATMGKRLLAAEKTAPTHPHPTAAGSPAAQWAAGPFASLVDRARDALNGGKSGS